MNHRPAAFVIKPTPTKSPPMWRSAYALGALALVAGCGWESLIGHARDGGGGTPQHDGGTGGGSGGGGVGRGGSPIIVTPVPNPHGPITGASKLDLLFVIDDSTSMMPLQEKMRARMSDFMNILRTVPGGMPDLHLAVITTSLGAGIFSNVSGCVPGTVGNLNGAFQHSAACTALRPDENFLKSAGGVNNFSGDLTDVFNCIANVGVSGCGFEHPFESTRLALQRANAVDPENFGFLREDAFLGIIMLTNEDDCSVAADSYLLDPNQQHLADPLGGLNSYRCNEFGHLCDGVPPPHQATGDVTLTNCVSAEDGRLVTVSGFVEFLKGLKRDPSKIFVAAIAGRPTPYVVQPVARPLANGQTEIQPTVAHSCIQDTPAGAPPQYADPAVRVAQFIRGFGPNGVFESICADDFGPTMQRIGQSMVGMMP